MPSIIASVLNVHEKCRDKLLPTPAQPHYSFSQRDQWLVLQGICTSSGKFVKT
jgi:hypothetical protein